MHSRTNHDVQMPLSRLPARDWQRIRSRNVAAAGGISVNTRKIARYDKAGEKAAGRPAGSVMTIEFQLEGQEFVALNGGPHFKFTEAISFVVNCETQEEVDYF